MIFYNIMFIKFFIEFPERQKTVKTVFVLVWGTSGSRFKSCRPDQLFQGVMNWLFGVNLKNGVSYQHPYQQTASMTALLPSFGPVARRFTGLTCPHITPPITGFHG